jgi:hypothetical protein
MIYIHSSCRVKSMGRLALIHSRAVSFRSRSCAFDSVVQSQRRFGCLLPVLVLTLRLARAAVDMENTWKLGFQPGTYPKWVMPLWSSMERILFALLGIETCISPCGAICRLYGPWQILILIPGVTLMLHRCQHKRSFGSVDKLAMLVYSIAAILMPFRLDQYLFSCLKKCAFSTLIQPGRLCSGGRWFSSLS